MRARSPQTPASRTVSHSIPGAFAKSAPSTAGADELSSSLRRSKPGPQEEPPSEAADDSLNGTFVPVQSCHLGREGETTFRVPSVVVTGCYHEGCKAPSAFPHPFLVEGPSQISFSPWGLWALSSLTPASLCLKCSLNHWTTRKVPVLSLKSSSSDPAQ